MESRRDDVAFESFTLLNYFHRPYGTQNGISTNTQHFVLGYFVSSLRDFVKEGPTSIEAIERMLFTMRYSNGWSSPNIVGINSVTVG